MEAENAILGNGEAADFELRKELWARLSADPEGYEANRDFGLYCASRRTLLMHAEPYLVKALDCMRGDPHDDQNLLLCLYEVYKLQGRFAEARDAIDKLRGRFPHNVIYMISSADLDYYEGDLGKASEAYERVAAHLRQRAKILAASRNERDRRILFPWRVLRDHLGEIAHKLDMFVKARTLGLIEDFEPVVLAPEGQVANMPLMECYRPHLTLVTDPDEATALGRSDSVSYHFVDYLKVPLGLTLHRELAYGVVQRLWSDRGLGAPIRPGDEVLEKGRVTLRSLGVPDGAWFAALHVRESGFFDEDQPWSHNKYRNADIAGYLPAMREITARGGWVLRMGDPSMAPLPPMDGVVDYAVGDSRSNWMDVFGLSQCRFFFGTASGPMNVARAFCVPVVATNYFPVGTWPFAAGDVFIHKLHRAADDGRWLSLAEVMKPPLFASWTPMVYERHGVEVVDNSPEDIRDAVVEMMDALDGTARRTREDIALQKRYRFVADPYNLGFLLPVSAAFLRRHPHLLDGG